MQVRKQADAGRGHRDQRHCSGGDNAKAPRHGGNPPLGCSGITEPVARQPQCRGEVLMRSNFAGAIGAASDMFERGCWDECGFTVGYRGQELAMDRAGSQLLASSQSGYQESPGAVDT